MVEKLRTVISFSLIGLLLVTPCFSATELRDEGTSKGYINVIDCVGNGVTCTKSGIVGTFSIPSTPVTLVDAANITPDASTSNFFIVTLTGQPRNLNNPLNGSIGQKIIVLISQDSTGSRKIGFGSNYSFGSTIQSYDATTTAGMHDYIGFIRGPVSWDVAAVDYGHR